MNTPNELPVASSVEARIVFLEDKLAAIYSYFADRLPGVTVKEEGPIAEIWSELDFLYITQEASA